MMQQHLLTYLLLTPVERPAGPRRCQRKWTRPLHLRLSLLLRDRQTTNLDPEAESEQKRDQRAEIEK